MGMLVRVWVDAGYCPILCTADSNVAVDNLVAGCAADGLSVVRLGRPEAIRPELESYTLDTLARNRLQQRGMDPIEVDAQAFWGHSSAILKGTQVICATCSGVASGYLDAFNFACVLIDEACQVTEPMTLLPIVRPGLRQTVLVGDHRQLPPTVVCKRLEQEGLQTPLFERLVTRGVAPMLLDVQFRMHPAIADYPSKQFYDSALKTGVVGAERLPPPGFDWPVPGVPIAFVPVKGEET